MFHNLLSGTYAIVAIKKDIIGMRYPLIVLITAAVIVTRHNFHNYGVKFN